MTTSYAPTHVQALRRLDAPRIAFGRSWVHIYVADPAQPQLFFPRKRRTWTLYVRGYPVVKLYGRVQDQLGRRLRRQLGLEG